MPVSKKTKKSKKSKSTARSVMGRILPPVDITNVNDLDEFDKRVEAGPVTLVFVYADWCGHCQRYKSNMDELEGMANRSVQTVRIRDDVFPKSSINNAKIEGYPSLLLIKPKGDTEDKPQPIVFEQDNGEISHVIPEHNNMKNMGAIVANAGTSAGLKILDKANVNKKNIVAVNTTNGRLVKNIGLLGNENLNKTLKNNKNTAIVTGLPLASVSPTPTPFATVKPTPMPFATASPTPTPFATVKPTPMPFATVKPTPMPFATASPTPMPFATVKPTPYIKSESYDTESSDSANRSNNDTIIYTPLSLSPGTPPDITLNRKSANNLVAEQEHVEDASTILSQERQKGGGLMDMLSKVAYQYGPATALLFMANVKAGSSKKTKKRHI